MPERDSAGDLGDHQYFAYLVFDDVNALHAEITATGLEITPPVDKPWGHA